MRLHSKIVALAAVSYLSMAAATPTALAGETFMTLKENVFMCVSPKAYDAAMARVSELDGRSMEPLKKELAETKQCMFVDAETVDGIEAPYVIIMERDGTKIQVQIVVTYRERIARLHRLMNRFILIGWTDESNLEEKQIL